MTKEIKEKIEITLDVYNNVVNLLKSSDEEDFFIGVKMWCELDPPNLLTSMMRKHTRASRLSAFNDELKEAGLFDPVIYHHSKQLWTALLNRAKDIDPDNYVQYRDIIEQEFNAYMNKKLENQGILKHVKPIKFKIKWQN